MKQSIADQKPAIDRLNKTGSALVKLLGDDESEKLQEILDDVTSRFDVIKTSVRDKLNVLDEAMHQTSQVSFCFIYHYYWFACSYIWFVCSYIWFVCSYIWFACSCIWFVCSYIWFVCLYIWFACLYIWFVYLVCMFVYLVLYLIFNSSRYAMKLHC